MKRDDSVRINDHFAARARDLTPPSARHAARVLYVPVSRDLEMSSPWASVLSDAELQRAGQVAAASDRDLFERRRAFRRFCGANALGSSKPLSEIDFAEAENGRPYLPDVPHVWFSFSACRLGLLGAWSTTHGVGVDIEDPTRSLEPTELARAYFSEAEANAVRDARGPLRARTFFRLWSLKEAALKSIGEGLPFGLDAFEFELVPSLRILRVPPGHGGPKQFDAQTIDGTDGCAAVVVRTPVR
jgi:phosphopantetheinyl transferase